MKFRTTNTDADTEDDVWYDVRIVADDANVSVYRGERGGPMEEVLSTTSAPTQATERVQFYCAPDPLEFDNIRILSDSLSNTTTYSYNDANELISMTDYNGTMSFGYDMYGRMTSKSRGSNSATYDWHYGGFLTSVTSNFPDEGNVTYDYGGNGWRRERSAAADTTYNWNGPSAATEEDSSGDLERTYLADGAQIDGTNPVSGTAYYVWADHLGSPRMVFDSNKNVVANFEFTPFGNILSANNLNAMTRLYTGHDWDEASQLYYAPFRYYDPKLGRWIARDPLGMLDGTNRYAYVGNVPVMFIDPLGLSSTWGDWWGDQGRALGSFWDGFLPFWDPFEGYYAQNNADGPCIPHRFRVGRAIGSVASFAIGIGGTIKLGQVIVRSSGVAGGGLMGDWAVGRAGLDALFRGPGNLPPAIGAAGAGAGRGLSLTLLGESFLGMGRPCF